MVWGLGPVFQFPTATDDELGTGKWSAGPTFVVFFDDRPLHVTTGFLINNLWSYAGDEDRSNVNAMTLQPFLNYNPAQGVVSKHQSCHHGQLSGPFPSAVA
jgi:hypothetical protein